MSCLLSQFKCLPHTFSANLNSPQPQHSKCKETINMRTQCVLSASRMARTATTTVIDVDKLQHQSLEANPDPLSGQRTWRLPVSTTAALNLEQLRILSLETHPSLESVNRRWIYTGTTVPPIEARHVAPLTKETFRTSDEAEAFITATASEAVALAKEALEVAKDATRMFNFSNSIMADTFPAATPYLNHPLPKFGDIELVPEELELLTNDEAFIAATAAKVVSLAQTALEVAKDAALMINSSNSITSDTNPAAMSYSKNSISENIGLGQCVEVGRLRESADFSLGEIDALLHPHSEYDDTEATPEELKLLDAELERSVAVRSRRQTEHRSKRTRAAEKAAADIMLVKSGSTSTSQKKPSSQDVVHPDRLRYFRGRSSNSRLLSATEEKQLSEGIQGLLKLERLQEELTLRCGAQPTFPQWAMAAGIDQKTLRQRLNYGILCKDKMVKSNIRLVISIAKHFQGSGMSLQDLVQEGCRGLIIGAEKFDTSKGFKFSTYAHWWIKQSVHKFLSDHSRTIRLPLHTVEATCRVKEARKQLFNKNGRLPDDKELAEATGFSMKKLSAVLLIPKAPRSLDQKIGINQNLKPSEVISDPEVETSEDILIKKIMRDDLDKVLDTLKPREKQVVRWRFGLEDGRAKTLQEIGELLGVSRERIRQIESCAFRKLKTKKITKHMQQYILS
ncbi:hypothetical protein Leryth_027296 [Lithospermum erythrorhizon]|nr:hypothetical protein Leryth_027296 [Lithospermum erythrorhizon]